MASPGAGRRELAQGAIEIEGLGRPLGRPLQNHQRQLGGALIVADQLCRGGIGIPLQTNQLPIVQPRVQGRVLPQLLLQLVAARTIGTIEQDQQGFAILLRTVDGLLVAGGIVQPTELVASGETIEGEERQEAGDQQQQ